MSPSLDPEPSLVPSTFKLQFARFRGAFYIVGLLLSLFVSITTAPSFLLAAGLFVLAFCSLGPQFAVQKTGRHFANQWASRFENLAMGAHTAIEGTFYIVWIVVYWMS